MKVLSRCTLDTVPRCHVFPNMVAIAVMGLCKICVFVTTQEQDCGNLKSLEKETRNLRELEKITTQKRESVDQEIPLEKPTDKKTKWSCVCFMIKRDCSTKPKQSLDPIPFQEEMIEDQTCEICLELKIMFFWDLLMGLVYRRWITHAIQINLEEVVKLTNPKALKLLNAVERDVVQKDCLERSQVEVRLRDNTSEMDAMVSALGYYMDMNVLRNKKIEDLGHCKSLSDLFDRNTIWDKGYCNESLAAIELSSENCGSLKREEKGTFPHLNIDSLVNDESTSQLIKRYDFPQACVFESKRQKLFSRLAEQTNSTWNGATSRSFEKDGIVEDNALVSKTSKDFFLKDSERNLPSKISLHCKNSDMTDRACFMCSVVISKKEHLLHKRFYGVLRRCDHVFCYGCIRSVIGTKKSRDPHVGPVICPNCGEVSESVAASSRWIGGAFEKEAFFEKFYNEIKNAN